MAFFDALAHVEESLPMQALLGEVRPAFVGMHRHHWQQRN